MNSNYLFDYFFIKKATRTNRKIVHVIGDSHVSVFTGLGTKENQSMQPEWPGKAIHTLPFFRTYRIGAVTAYNSLNKIKTIKKILRFKSSNINKRDDIILLCFGEIDVRVHLIKQSKKQNITIAKSVRICVDRYFETILRIKKMGYNVGVWGVIPSTPLEEISDDIPIIGDCKERNEVTKLFNDYLFYLCNKNAIDFISIYEDVINENGLTSEEFYMDGFHLSQTAMPIILQKIKQFWNIKC